MPLPHLEERSLRDAIARLRAVYDRAQRRLPALTSQVAIRNGETPSAHELTGVLGEIDAADGVLRQIVESWSRTQPSLRRLLATDVEALRQSAASCLALVSTTEREYGLKREQVVRQMDEGVTRNRAVRAYSHAMRQ